MQFFLIVSLKKIFTKKKSYIDKSIYDIKNILNLLLPIFAKKLDNQKIVVFFFSIAKISKFEWLH